jgi:sulfide:quinone oxidoreductase
MKGIHMRVLVLGAGFGGMEVATSLSEALGDQVSVTLIDKSAHFIFGFSKLDVMFGLQAPEAIRLPYTAFSKPGVEFRQETIRSIDPVRKSATADQGTYEADVLVVALGADLNPAATPGLVDHGFEYYSEVGAERARNAIANFKGGNVVVGVVSPQYKCPPAPSETALMMHDWLIERGLREQSTVTLVTPFPSPLPVSPEVGATILTELQDRGIGFVPGAKISGVDDGALHLADGQALPCDLLLAVPLHVAPPVVVEAGMTENGWIPTDAYTLQSRFPGVYAFGDVASVGVPRAGIFSEGQAKIVARQIIDDVRSESNAERYQGIGQCYIEFGHGKIGKVDVNFLGGPSTTAKIHLPSAELRSEKNHFGSSRRARWFGMTE